MRYDEVVEKTNEVIGQYEIDLTVRQIYYRLVSPPYQIFPNTRIAYKTFDKILTKARERLDVNWRRIVDRSRVTSGGDFGYGSPGEYIDHKIKEFGECYYSRRMWDDQPRYVEVWVEKDALGSLFEEACRGYRVVIFPSRGYSSFTKVMEAFTDRIAEAFGKGKDSVILDFSDHDPSGLDITQDIMRRFNRYFPYALRERFTNEEMDEIKEQRKGRGKDYFCLFRPALTHEQVKRFNLAPNPTKFADPRAREYVEKYGNECWELDAIPPDELVRIIREAVESQIDREAWNKTLEKAKEEKAEVEKKLKRMVKKLRVRK